MKKVLLTVVFLSLIFTGCQDEGIFEEDIEITAAKGTKTNALEVKGLELLWDLSAPNGYLFTDDVSSGKLWGWTDNSTAYANISAPIAYYLYQSKLKGLKEAAIAGFDAMYYRTSGDLTSFSSADVGVLLYAYKVTKDAKYLTLVNDMTANWIAKYPSSGFPHRGYDTYWGYDSMNWMRSAYYIKHVKIKKGLVGLSQALIDWADESIAAYEAAQGAYMGDPYHVVFTNVVKSAYHIGVFTPVTITAADEAQVLAYARIGKSINKEFITEMENALFIDNGGVSEVAAELIAALAKR